MRIFFDWLALIIPKDKLLHWFYGTTNGFILVSLFDIFGVVAVFGIALAKEIIDVILYSKEGKKYEIKGGLLDILATVIPSILFYFS